MPALQLDDLQVEVVRKNIRSLRLTVYAPDGRIRVAVPTRTSDAVVREFVAARRAWIRKHQEKFQARHPAVQPAYVSGETHYYQGRPYVLQVHTTTGVARVCCAEPQEFRLYVREGSTPQQREKVLTACTASS